MKWKNFFILLGLIFLFFGVQIIYLKISAGRINCDDALTGLTALGILLGERPIFLPGQVYGGTLKAYLTALFFKIFGVSPFILLFTASVFAAGAIVGVYFLGKLLFSEVVGILGALYLTIAPAAFFGYAHSAIGTYIENVFFGNLILIFAVLVTQKNKKNFIAWILLGLVSGLAWWVNYAVIYYLLTVAIFIILRKKDFFKNAGFYLAIFFFFVGSLPYWIFNFQHRFLTFSQINNPVANKQVILSNFNSFLKVLLPKVLGLVEPSLTFLSESVLLIYAIFFIWFVIAFFRKKLKQNSEILLILLLVIAGIYSFSPYGQREVIRFILPLYSIVPLIFGWGVGKLWEKKKFLAVLCFCLIFAVNFNQEKEMFKNSILKKGENTPGEKNLINFLNEKKLFRCYAPKEIGQIITFKTKEKIICASLEGEVIPRYSLEVNATQNPAFIFHDDKKKASEIFENALKWAGGNYQKTLISPNFTVFYAFTPPAQAHLQLPLLLKGVKANVNQEGAFSVIDRCAKTIWEPHKNKMVAGEEIIVDIGGLEVLSKIVILPAEFKKEKYSGYPLGFKVYGSKDTLNWKHLAELPEYHGTLFWAGPRPFYKIPDGRIELRFAPEQVRFIKIIQTANHPKYGWGINEIFFYEPLEEPQQAVSTLAEFSKLKNFLKNKGVRKVFANLFINARLFLEEPQFFTTPRTFNELEFDQRFPFSEKNQKIFIPDKETALVVKNENAELTEAILIKEGLTYQKTPLNMWQIFYNFKNPGKKEFFWDGENLLKM